MTISFSGLGSGMNTSSWIEALVQIKQDKIDAISSKVGTIQSTSSSLTSLKSNYSSLLSSITKLTDSKLGGSFDIFSQKSATSSDSSKLTVSVNSQASIQNLDINIQQLATNTIAKSTNSIAKNIDIDTVFTNLLNGSAKEGSFSFYVDNKKYSIEIEKDETLDSIQNKMIDATKSGGNPHGLISISIQDGKFTIDAGAHSLNVGSAQDTSNFASVLSLTKDPDLNKFSSSYAINEMNLNNKILGGTAGFSQVVTAGTFTIGGKEFTIDENTTLNSLISKINSSTDAGVNASFDSVTGKLILTSKQTGSFNINVENGTSNFLEVTGLTNGDKIADGSQTLGENALLTVNGNDIECFNNTVSSESTGLTGVTLTLLGTTTGENDKNVNVNVSSNNSSVLDSVNSFISAYNTVITKTDGMTGKSGALQNETSLYSIRSNLRSAISNPVSSNTTYKTLADIGITTGEVGTSITANTNQLQIDKDKFMEALQDNPEEVRKLLIGSSSDNTEGIIGDLKTITNTALDSESGYFQIKSDSLQRQVDSLNEKITKKTEEMEAYSERLKKQFDAMDQAIAQMNNQYSGLLNSLSS